MGTTGTGPSGTVEIPSNSTLGARRALKKEGGADEALNESLDFGCVAGRRLRGRRAGQQHQAEHEGNRARYEGSREGNREESKKDDKESRTQNSEGNKEGR